MKLLQVFYDTLPAKTKLIEEYERQENIQNYTIEVHALKSAAKLIGAMELSKQAEYLENCGKTGNIEDIHKKTPQLLETYRSYIKYLQPYVQIKEEVQKKMLNPALQEELLKQLLQCVTEFDLDGADVLMEELSGYEHEEEFLPVFELLKEAVENVDYEKVQQLIRKYIKAE